MAFVDDADLAATGSAQGANMVGFIQDGTGAVQRTAMEKLREIISVLDFGADPTGTVDSTAAFNAACAEAQPTTGNEDQPRREIFIPAGKYRIDGTVYVRKGQHLRGSGLGCFIDCSHRVNGTGAVIKLGSNSDGLDPGGLGAAISDFFFHALLTTDDLDCCIEPTDAGFWIDHCFFTGCGQGIHTSTRAGDGLNRPGFVGGFGV